MAQALQAADGVRITLPDGSVKEFPEGVTVAEVAESIGSRLAKAALAGKVNGQVVDLGRPVEHDVELEIITEKSPEALELLRHSAAHILATAVRRIRPDAKIGFGPAIRDGFYYDFEVDRPFSSEELAEIEQEMQTVTKCADPFQRQVVTVDEAREMFAGDPLKLERLEEFSDAEIITIYRNGPFLDLCRGPHLPATDRLKHFRLLSTAGAYWRGDERRQMLQRIYGTAWFSKQEVEEYLERLEEAKRRDHRALGQALDLFSTDPRVGPGLILWHPKGAIIRNQIEEFERELILRHGYELVYTPHIMSERLFEISGHLENFAENIFGPVEVEGARYRAKPMNCPGHICIYQAHVRSYRDLPIRYAEYGTVYRYERSGALHGMLRVRGFTQDDAHVFCTPEQVREEVGQLLDLVDEMLSVFGYPYTIELSTRPEHALGTEEEWRRAEETLASVLRERGQEFKVDEGGGAFYGPKLDFKLIDAIGREWQGPTVQLDFNLPDRFELEYVGADNQPHRPVMLHRVLVGSMERFVGGLIEHYAGAFPIWLAPVQVMVIPISDDQTESARELVEQLKAKGLRAQLDARNETLNYKIREAETQKIPYMAVIGGREAEASTVAVRVRGRGRKQVILDRGVFAEHVLNENRSRSLQIGFAEADAPTSR